MRRTDVAMVDPGNLMPRDDWKYDEDMWEDDGTKEEKGPSEKQCPRCQHWVPRETPYCTWCGKVFEEEKKP